MLPPIAGAHKKALSASQGLIPEFWAIVTNRTRCAFVPVYRLAYKGTLSGASRSGAFASALRQLQASAEAKKAFLKSLVEC